MHRPPWDQRSPLGSTGQALGAGLSLNQDIALLIKVKKNIALVCSIQILTVAVRKGGIKLVSALLSALKAQVEVSLYVI